MKYETKDSGQRLDYDSGMRRDVQDGKARFDLLLADGMPYAEQFLTRCAELMMRGADKYGERNWELADSEAELLRFKGSAIRHATQWLCGEDDEDHAAAVFFNLMAAEYVKWRLREAGRQERVARPSSMEFPSGGGGGGSKYYPDNDFCISYGNT